MSNRVNKKKEKLDSLYKKLVEKAEEDGVITEDERKILDKVATAIDKFKEYADLALEDNIVTVGEHTELLSLQNKLLRDVEGQALDDHRITPDEKRLLELLIKTIRVL